MRKRTGNAVWTERLSCGNGMRRWHAFAVTMALFLLLPGQVWGDEAWVEYDSSNTTLTFKYGSKPDCFGEGVTAYALNEGGGEPGWIANSDAVTTVVFDSSFANARPTTMHKWFYSMKKLSSIMGIANLKTDEVTRMSQVFYDCYALTSVDLSGFNTQKVTNMSCMFFGCKTIEGLDVSSFDTQNVEDMNRMFQHCEKVKTLNLTNFNTSKVTDMGNMFAVCPALETVNVSSFNTEKVNSMYCMFLSCESLASVDVSKFNTSLVNNMESMFCNCYVLASIDLTNFNTANVTDMHNMFSSCKKLTILDLSSFNTARVSNMQGMFENCENLAKIYVSDTFTTEGIVSYDYDRDTSEGMFRNCWGLSGAADYDGSKTNSEMANYNSGYFTLKTACSEWVVYNKTSNTLTFLYGAKPTAISLSEETFQLNSGDEEPQWLSYASDIQSVVFDSSFDDARPTTCNSWFYRMACLTEISGLEYLHTDCVTDMKRMFSSCGKLTALDLTSFNTENVTDMTDMFAGCTALATVKLGKNFNTAKVKDMSSMFGLCESLTSLDVSGFTTDNVSSMTQMFRGCGKLTTLGVSGFNTGNVTDMSGMFSDCEGLTELDVSGFNTEKVTDMSNMFTACKGLAKLDVSGFNTGNVTDMSGIFSGCSSLKALDVSGFNTENVTKMLAMFAGCEGLTELNLQGFNTAKVMSMYGMFSGCTGLTTLDVSKFDTRRVSDMEEMFSGCTNLKTLEIGSDFITTRVTSMNKMFYNCGKLASVDLSGFNTTSVTDMQEMFAGCSSLTTLDLSAFSTENVTEMNAMFRGCTGMVSLDVSTFNTGQVTNMQEMFSGCTNLKRIYAGDQFTTGSVTVSDNMFNGCTALVGATAYSADKTDAEMANYNDGYFIDKSLCSAWAEYDSSTYTLTFMYGKKPSSFAETVTSYELNTEWDEPGWVAKSSKITGVVFDSSFADARPTSLHRWFYSMKNLSSITGMEYLNTNEVTQMTQVFYDCYTLKSLELSKLNTKKVTNMREMFFGCKAIEALDVSSFDTGNVTDMYCIFQNCEQLTTLNLSNFNTENVTDMTYMFAGCTSLTKIDLSSFNTAKATGMTCMFWECTSLPSVDVSNFNTELVSNMESMFCECWKLTSIDLKNFNTANVKDMHNMFQNCKQLTTLDLTSFNTAQVNKMEAMFRGCENLTTIYASDSFTTSGITDTSTESGTYEMFKDCTLLVGAVKYDADKTDGNMANATTGYFSVIPSVAAWAEYDHSNNTLTFKYGKKTASAGETVTVYDLNNGTTAPGWVNTTTLETTKVEHVVFDASFDEVRPTSCYMWFYMMPYLTDITGLEYLHTDSVTTMNSMFCYCTKLQTLDLTPLNTANVTDMASMFKGCSSLTTVYVSDQFTTTATQWNDDMFYGCTLIEGATAYDENKADLSRANYRYGFFKTYYKIGSKTYDISGDLITVSNLDVKDGEDFITYAPFTATEARYSRYNMTSNWATLCLPFAVDADNTDDCTFYELSSIDDISNTITLTRMTGSIAAGTPVFVYFNSCEKSSMDIVSSNVDVVRNPTEGKWYGGLHLVGSFVTTEVPDYGYIVSKNKFWLVEDLKDSNKGGATAVKVRGQRAWLNPNSNSGAKAKALSIAVEDETTSIDALRALTEGTAETFDMHGRRTGGLQKGLNIIRVNGTAKKVLVK